MVKSSISDKTNDVLIVNTFKMSFRDEAVKCLFVLCVRVILEGLVAPLYNVHVRYRVVTMVNKCTAFRCKNNPTPGKGDQQVTFHAYPLQNKELCDKWIQANQRKDFIPSTHSKTCSAKIQSKTDIHHRTADHKT